MACLRSQQRVGRLAVANGIAPLASRNAYLAAIDLTKPELTTREITDFIFHESLRQRQRVALLLGRNPDPDRNEMRAYLVSSTLVALLVKARLKKRRQRGQLGQLNT